VSEESDDPPDPAALADRHDAVHRVHEREVDAETFVGIRERVERGFEWGVGGLAATEASRVLLVREDGRWLLPGGEVEAGESHAEALAREFREETGLSVTVGPLLSVTEQAYCHDGERTEFRFAIYRVEPEATGLTDDPGRAGEGIEAIEWVEELPEDTLDRDLLVDLLD
jgi:8-oxo-dGTP pyrophosphatase MutT (NUDIX family)